MEKIFLFLYRFLSGNLHFPLVEGFTGYAFRFCRLPVANCLLVLCTVFIAGSCHKNEAVMCKDGFIRWEGDPAADGLGWVFREDTGWPVPLKLKNLPERYQVNSLPVHVCLYDTGETFRCRCATPPPVYKITRISKR